MFETQSPSHLILPRILLAGTGAKDCGDAEEDCSRMMCDL